MASSRTIVAKRYAKALFALAKSKKKQDKVAQDIQNLNETIIESADLAAVLLAPIYGRKEQQNVVEAIAKKLKADTVSLNFFKTLADNRRLNVLEAIVEEYHALLREDKGELLADVISAVPLKAAQKKEIQAKLKSSLGKKVDINVQVDESLLGGLKIRLGSTMLDASVASKLERIRDLSKEAVANL